MLERPLVAESNMGDQYDGDTLTLMFFNATVLCIYPINLVFLILNLIVSNMVTSEFVRGCGVELLTSMYTFTNLFAAFDVIFLPLQTLVGICGLCASGARGCLREDFFTGFILSITNVGVLVAKTIITIHLCISFPEDTLVVSSEFYDDPFRNLNCSKDIEVSNTNYEAVAFMNATVKSQVFLFTLLVFVLTTILFLYCCHLEYFLCLALVCTTDI